MIKSRAQNFQLITFLLSILTFSTAAQSFERYKDNASQYSAIRYYKIDYKLVIEKRIPFDTNESSYFIIGLIGNNDNFTFIDGLMRSDGSIVLANGTKLNFQSEHTMSDFERGTTAIRHRLTEYELNQLLNEPIEYFTAIGMKKEFDKYERQHILNAIKKLQNEQY